MRARSPEEARAQALTVCRQTRGQDEQITPLPTPMPVTYGWAHPENETFIRVL